MIVKIDSDEQAEKLLSENKDNKIVICFSASWCAPCRVYAPILEKVSNEQDVTIYKIDIDECTEFSLKHKIRSVPTLSIFSNEKNTNSCSGVLKPDEVVAYLK